MRLVKRLMMGLAGLLAVTGLTFAEAAAAPSPAPSATSAAPRDSRTNPRPAIWLLADADTRIYLFGTVHILSPRLRWRSTEFDRIAADVDELVLEVGEDPDRMRPSQLIGPMMLAQPVPVLSRVSPGRRTALRRMMAESGMPRDAFDRMHTWAVALMLEVTAIARAYAREGIEIDDLTGVEDVLRAEFERSGRPISGVETSAQQLGFFRAMRGAAQRAFLEALIESWVDGDLVLDPEERGWVSGDVDSIASEIEALPPELFDLLITRRNRTWTGWLIDRLDRPGTVLFAVGAGHLAGRDSLQSMLAAEGFGVTRLNPQPERRVN